MMRRSKRPLGGERAIADLARDGRDSVGDSGGRIEGSRAASIDLPAPGEPIISMRLS
jgi:hypothetical protein